MSKVISPFHHHRFYVQWGLPGGSEGVAWGLGGVNLTEPSLNPQPIPYKQYYRIAVINS